MHIFSKKSFFGKKNDYLSKNDYFGENPKLSKLIQIQWNEMQSDMSMGIYDDWSYHNSASVSIQWVLKIYSVNGLVISS